MSTSINITDVTTETFVHVSAGTPVIKTTDGALDLPCSKIEMDTEGNFVGTVLTANTYGGVVFAVGDQAVFKIAQIAALTPTA